MVDRKTNDLEILWTPPQTPVDERVPTAQELAASSHLHQQNLESAQRIERPAGVRNRPAFTAAASRGVVLPSGLLPYSPGHPSLAALANNVTVNLPALADTDLSISRYDHIGLFVFAGVVTAAIDPQINLQFEWQGQSGAIQTLSKENTRRLRTFWAVVVSQGATTAQNVFNALPLTGGIRRLTASTSATGSALNATHQIYAIDPNLVNGQQYEIVADTIDLIPLLRVWRVQNFTQGGYVWGRGGEIGTYLPDYHLQPTYRFVGDGWDRWEARARETLRRVFLGQSLPGSPGSDRLVQNLLNGQVSGNLDAPGLATASPNGSTALANSQRISFTNQAIQQREYCLPIVCDDAGGFARASVPFQVNSPSGSAFSASLADHRVFSNTGRDITGDGTITGLGSTGALVWTANSNIVIPGDTVYFQPAINYPAGSGFANTGAIEAVYRNGAALDAANIREGSADGDINAYTAPAAGQSFIVVLGKERAALHYIYKRVTVSSDSSGRVVIPSDERGAIAFISGANAPAGRIDRPVITGLNASATYNLLVYYPPPPTENWQFQFKTARYAGTGESSLLNGSRIATHPIAIAHTQGGGNSVFLADGELQYEAIAFRLPANTAGPAIKHFLANYKIQFAFEGEINATSLREVWLSSAAGLAQPKAGQVLVVQAGVGSQSKGIAARLLADGRVLGISKLPILCGQIYQLVVAFVVEKAGEQRLAIATLNEGNPQSPSSVSFDSDAPGYAGIDTFGLY